MWARHPSCSQPIHRAATGRASVDTVRRRERACDRVAHREHEEGPMTTIEDHRIVPTDVERLAALRRMKRVATGLLVVAAVVFAVSFALQDEVPWLAYVRAAAE